jgi:hypothetical protein
VALDKAVAIEQRMDGVLGRNFDARKSADQALANLSCVPPFTLSAVARGSPAVQLTQARAN